MKPINRDGWYVPQQGDPWLREATPEEAAEFDRLESIRADSRSSSS